MSIKDGVYYAELYSEYAKTLTEPFCQPGLFNATFFKHLFYTVHAVSFYYSYLL